MIGQLIGGSDFSPIIDEKAGIDEPANMTQAYKAYFEATGEIDIPPGLMLAIVLISYVAPRLRMEKTQTRIKRAGAFVRGIFKKVRGK